MRRGGGVLVLACLAALLVACTGGSRTVDSGTVTILASTSLTDAITGMASAYNRTYPGVTFQTTFLPDSQLAQRVTEGPAPDIIAAEDPATLTAAGATGTPVHFARGQLVMAVPTGNPARVSQLADLVRADIRLALCEPEQPCGRVAEAVLAAAQFTVPADALREADVRTVLSRVTDGTADVALVYRSDARAAGDAVATIETPFASAALTDFVAVVADDAPSPRTAQRFLDYLGSPAVRDALIRDGFRPPD